VSIAAHQVGQLPVSRITGDLATSTPYLRFGRESVIPAGCIMLGMKWKADRTTIIVAFALVAAGWARIALAHDRVLGGALIGVGIILAVRIFFYFRTPDA
jgi:hypothetical protein